MTSIIESLGRALSDRWRARGYKDWEFPPIVRTTLEEFELHRQIESIVDHLFVENENVLVSDHSSPDVACLHSAPHFSIYLHTWIDGLAAMHHHSWAGAYQLLVGSSVDARYSFLEERRLATGLAVGDLHCDAVDELRAGDIRLVEPGARNIHTLSYNERACLTISVRSNAILGETTFNYWRPGLAIETLGTFDFEKARAKVLRYLSYANPTELVQRMNDWVSRRDLRTVFRGLEVLVGLPTRIASSDLTQLMETGKAAHGSVFETIANAARQAGQPNYHRGLRGRVGIDDRDLRRFLSYLFVCPDRETCLSRIPGPDGREELIKRCQYWCRRILELDTDVSTVAGWTDSLLPVLDSLILTGSVTETVRDVATRYEVDEGTMDLVSGACERFRWHPAFGILTDGNQAIELS